MSVEELIQRLSLSESDGPIEGDVEMWRAIEGYEDYWISSLGRVISIKSKRILKQGNNGKGYPMVVLYKDAKAKTCKVHRLVAQGFIPNPENLQQVDHINAVRSDNSINNLRWASASTNQQNRLSKGSVGRVKMGNNYYYEVRYCPVRGGNRKKDLFRIEFPENPESCYNAACLALEHREKKIAEINAQLPRYQQQ